MSTRDSDRISHVMWLARLPALRGTQQGCEFSKAAQRNWKTDDNNIDVTWVPGEMP